MRCAFFVRFTTDSDPYGYKNVECTFIMYICCVDNTILLTSKSVHEF